MIDHVVRTPLTQLVWIPGIPGAAVRPPSKKTSLNPEARVDCTIGRASPRSWHIGTRR